MPNTQRDVISRSEQLHHGFLVTGLRDVCTVHFQYPITDPQLAAGSRRASRHHLNNRESDEIDSDRDKRMNITCDMKIPGSLAPNGMLEWSVPPIILNPRDPLALLRVTSW